MKSAKIAVFALSVLVIGAALGQGTARAQVYGATPIAAMPASVCVNLAYSLGQGSTDYYTRGAVTQLQQFLAGQGYFNSAYLGTGRFGPITARAVAQYQAAHGISPIGVVGPLTRAAIYNQTCGSVVPPINQAPGTSGINPSSGPTGTQVTVLGYNFTNDNTVLIDGMVAARNVPAQNTGLVCITYPCQGSQSVTFTVPEYTTPYCAPGMACIMIARQVTPGAYKVTVQNQNGTSNPQTFTVTGGTANTQPVSINGLDAPSTLSMGASGTWTVHATAGANSGTLRYSVVWGDEGYSGGASVMMPQPTATQTSTTFTHAYQYAGTFRPTFTVTDDAGHSATVSSTVTVTPLYVY